MKICLSGSMRHRELLRDVSARLRALGHEPLFPNLDSGSAEKDANLTVEEKNRLALEHFAAIAEADLLYILTHEGYMGTSCKLELGYAIAKGKAIYFSEPTNDIGLDGHARGKVVVEV